MWVDERFTVVVYVTSEILEREIGMNLVETFFNKFAPKAMQQAALNAETDDDLYVIWGKTSSTPSFHGT